MIGKINYFLKYNSVIIFIKKIKIIYDYKLLNKKYFRKNNHKNAKGIILVEFNSFYNNHFPLAHLANALSDKFNSRIVGFFNYYILSSEINEKFIIKLKWFIGNFFSLKFFGIYSSFGCSEIIKPKISRVYVMLAKKKAQIIIKKIKNKNDILNIKIDNIPIGDLIYDSFLKKEVKPTIDISCRKLFQYIFDTLKLFYYWQNYLKKNNVKAIVGVHGVYAYAIILRIAVFSKIPVYLTNLVRIYKINKNSFYENSKLFNFKKNFNKLPDNFKIKALFFSKKKIEGRIYGTKHQSDLIHSDNSNFRLNQGKFKILIKNTKKIKILICTHDFFDAVHVCGPMVFNDFYEWLLFLGEFSKNHTEYDWYIKTHPSFSHWKKNNLARNNTNFIIKNFLKKYNNIIELPNNYSHLDIVNQGIDFVLTCYGTVGFEYAFLNIPVINACKNNFHSDYNFNINPKNFNEYKKILENLHKVKLKIKKNEIYEYYFMRRFFFGTEWFVDNMDSFNNYMGSVDNYFTYKIYEYWLKSSNYLLYKKRMNTINNFLKSNNKVISFLHKNSINDIQKYF
jgi:hypothetical protein